MKRSLKKLSALQMCIRDRDAARQCGMEETELVDILKLLFEEA